MSGKTTLSCLGILFWVICVLPNSFVNGSILNSHLAYDDQSLLVNKNYVKSTIGLSDGMTLLKITGKNLNDSVRFGESIIAHLNRLETNLGRSDVKVQHGTPAHGQFIENEPTSEGLQLTKAALIAARASQNLINSHCQKVTRNKVSCAKFLNTIKMTSTPLEYACSLTNVPCSYQETYSTYRKIDGSCNHRSVGSQGKSYTAYRRLLFPSYLDGIMTPRRSVTKKPLPSARLVSARIINNVDRFDSRLTLAFMQWSQFVAHDMSYTATTKMMFSENPIVCCDRSGYSLSPRYLHPMCMPITIPSEDQFYSKHRTNCMSYVRSLPAISPDCTFGPINQLNQATHYLDGSQIYGCSLNKSNSLREFRGGRLLTSEKDGRKFLPTSTKMEKLCQDSSDKVECYKSGDSRVNIQPHLTVMHTFWTREHNRIATDLEKINPHWGDERIFMETRRIIIAEIQHITYTQWLPILIGKVNADKINQHHVYNENIDASVSNAFATAAIRFVNSLMTSELQLFEENRSVNSSYRLQDHFNNPIDLHTPGKLDGLIRGLSTQKSQMMDLHFISDLTQQLYKTGKYGMDALSLDIQRGRDHGLPAYVEYRKYCGLPSVENFSDLRDHIPQQTVDLLSQIYSNVQDIDLIIGGLAEEQVDDSLLGPTFTCIIGEQMLRTRIGDRFFYTDEGDLDAFTEEQLNEIKKTTLANIFCDNGDDIKNMQPDVFTSIRQGNNLVSCNDKYLQRIDLNKWKEEF